MELLQVGETTGVGNLKLTLIGDASDADVLSVKSICQVWVFNNKCNATFVSKYCARYCAASAHSKRVIEGIKLKGEIEVLINQKADFVLAKDYQNATRVKKEIILLQAKALTARKALAKISNKHQILKTEKKALVMKIMMITKQEKAAVKAEQFEKASSFKKQLESLILKATGMDAEIKKAALEAGIDPEAIVAETDQESAELNSTLAVTQQIITKGSSSPGEMVTAMKPANESNPHNRTGGFSEPKEHSTKQQPKWSSAMKPADESNPHNKTGGISEPREHSGGDSQYAELGADVFNAQVGNFDASNF